MSNFDQYGLRHLLVALVDAEGDGFARRVWRWAELDEGTLDLLTQWYEAPSSFRHEWPLLELHTATSNSSSGRPESPSTPATRGCTTEARRG